MLVFQIETELHKREDNAKIIIIVNLKYWKTKRGLNCVTWEELPDTEEVQHLDKPDELTVSGVSRGEMKLPLF